MIVKITLKERKQKKENENKTKYITMKKEFNNLLFVLFNFIIYAEL